jgi:DNA polymerase elongation subunit (family B)
LKRRDNAPIVKDIYGGLIDILMKEHDIPAAIAFVKDFLQDIVDEKFPLEKLIITKKLSSFYKNPQSIAHRVLADRMGKRDPGTKPSVGSRVPFVFIQTKAKVKLQGNRIENPDYIRENKIRPDYGFYITNQIMKPVQQVFALILEDIPSFKRKVAAFKRKCEYLKQECKGDEEKYDKKEEALRNKEVKKLIFDDVLRQANNIKCGQKSIKKFFG